MNQLSDLELVAQAMSGSTPGPGERPNGTSAKANGDITPTNISEQPQARPEAQSGSQPQAQAAAGSAPPAVSSLGLDGPALASLTSLLSLSDSDLEGLDEQGIADILSQMEAADGVADDLESKLDRLLATLGGVEEEIVAGQEQKGESENAAETKKENH